MNREDSAPVERAGEGGEAGPSRDDLFEMVSNRRRRHTVHYLRGRERPVDLGDLATRLAAWETGQHPDAVTPTERRRVYVALRQSHLPKLDDADVVDYDPDRSVVEPGPGLANAEVYVDVVRGRELPRSEVYLGIGGVAAALLTVAWLDVPPFGLLPDIAWAFLVVGVFVAAAAADTYCERDRRLGAGDPPPGVEVPDSPEEPP